MRNESSLIDDRQLQEALRDADAASSGRLLKVDAASLVAAVGRRRARSRQVRIAAAASLVLLAVVLRDSSPPANTSPRIIAKAPAAASAKSMGALHDELARLEREAALHQRVVRGLRRAERLATQETELAAATEQAPPPALAAQEAERAAAISMQYAAIVEQELRDLNRARLEYQRINQRFPGTSWADMAATSLKRLPMPN